MPFGWHYSDFVDPNWAPKEPVLLAAPIRTICNLKFWLTHFSIVLRVKSVNVAVTNRILRSVSASSMARLSEPIWGCCLVGNVVARFKGCICVLSGSSAAPRDNRRWSPFPGPCLFTTAELRLPKRREFFAISATGARIGGRL